jgi:hypothetical protein
MVQGPLGGILARGSPGPKSIQVSIGDLLFIREALIIDISPVAALCPGAGG